MGLKGDVDQVISIWASSSWPMRAWLLLSFFLAISGIASLADTVVSWKGFLLEGVSFYQTWVRTPIANAFSEILSFTLPVEVLDMAFALLLYGSSVARGRRHIDFDSMLVMPATAKFEYWGHVIGLWGSSMGLSLLCYWTIPTSYINPGVVLYGSLLFLLVLDPGINNDGPERKVAILSMTMPVGTVFVLAAINSGLSR